MARLSSARRISYDVLVEVLSHQKDPAAQLARHFEEHGPSLKRVDRNLAYEIVFGSLRMWTKIHWIVQNYAHRDIEKCSMAVQVALVAGSYQIYHLSRIPDRASVNESVEYVRARDEKNAVPFVNGILRQVAHRSRYFTKPDSESQPVEFLSLQFSHPPWIISRWLDRFGYKRLEEMLRTSNKRPPTTIRFHALQVRAYGLQNVQRKLLKQEKTRIDKRPLRYAFHLMDPPQLVSGSLFDKGLYTIQGEASQLIAYLVDPQEGEFIVDACAGPGGKLTHIYELAAEGSAALKSEEGTVGDDAGKEKNVANQEKAHGEQVAREVADDIVSSLDEPKECGVKLWAFESKPEAYAKMLSNLQRLKCHGVMCFHRDFLTYQPGQHRPSKILLDAPCSGLGVLRRHPEGKLFKKPSIIQQMAARQRELLVHSMDILAPGGELIYSVCSFEPEETIHHLDWLEETFSAEFTVVNLQDRLQGYYRRYLTKRQMLWIYAGGADAMDGFGAFVLKKTS